MRGASPVVKSASAKRASRKSSFVPPLTLPTTPLLKDPSYPCFGLKLAVQYVRLPTLTNNVRVQATLYHGKQLVPNCNW